MSLSTTMEILSSGLTASRLRMNIIASNLANANSTRRAAGGGPYQRQDPVYKSTEVNQHRPAFADVLKGEFDDSLRGVQVTQIVKDQTPGRTAYDPGHPDADANGLVRYPNVNMLEEMVDMIVASRVYEAGITAMQSVKSMKQKALTIGK